MLVARNEIITLVSYPLAKLSFNYSLNVMIRFIGSYYLIHNLPLKKRFVCFPYNIQGHYINYYHDQELMAAIVQPSL